MDADAARLDGPGREVREDDGDVPDLGHNGVGLVGLTLLESAGMNMDVGDDSAPGLPAMGPEVAEPTSVDHDDAGLESVRVDVIVEDELLDAPRLAHGAKKERAALPPSAGPPAKLCHAGVPDGGVAEKVRPRSERDARERCY